MTVMNELLKQAMAYSGAVGQYQGFIAFVKNNPDYYSHEELITELSKLTELINAQLEAVEEQ